MVNTQQHINAQEVKVHDKTFVPFITDDEILERLKIVADEVTRDLAGKNPLFLAVLNGSFFFAADLLKLLDFDCEISFVKVATYSGMQSTGSTKTLLGLEENITGRHVVVLEDIVDTGFTMYELIKMLNAQKPASLRIATLIFKPDALKHDVKLDYIGFSVPDDFLIGYGLDYNKQGRHYNHIYKLKP